MAALKLDFCDCRALYWVANSDTEERNCKLFMWSQDVARLAFSLAIIQKKHIFSAKKYTSFTLITG
jgi:hypothetical protein